MKYMTIGLIILLSVIGCTSESPISSEQPSDDVVQLRALHELYVDGWLENNEEQVMNLLEDNAMIQPNKMNPIIGKENIRDFWFPKDSSITIINTFDTEVVHLQLKDTIAIMTHTSYLDWDYKLDTISFGMIQQGINTTVYLRQADNQWKIWRSMWTDISATSK